MVVHVVDFQILDDETDPLVAERLNDINIMIVDLTEFVKKVN